MVPVSNSCRWSGPVRVRGPGSIVRSPAGSELPRPGWAALVLTRCTVQVMSASASVISSTLPSSWWAKIRNRAAWRLTRHCASLNPPAGSGTSPTRSGPMKNSSGLLPTRAMPIAGWMRYVVAMAVSSPSADTRRGGGRAVRLIPPAAATTRTPGAPTTAGYPRRHGVAARHSYRHLRVPAAARGLLVVPGATAGRRRRAVSVVSPVLSGRLLAVPLGQQRRAAPYVATVRHIGPALRHRMRFSHRAGCPVPLADLRYLRMTYVGFDGRAHTGEMVVHADHAEAVTEVFRRLYDARWPLRRMVLVDVYGGDDDRSMAADNTSGFNCRRVAGSDGWSRHAFGAAIDVNPVQNPYVQPSGVVPPAGRRFATLDRSAAAEVPEGVVRSDDVVVQAFARIGWLWGGDWSSAKDYQHFYAAGG